MSTSNNFNTEVLLRNVNDVVQVGLNDIFSDFLSKYKLYEQTYNAVMKLPGVSKDISNIQTNTDNFVNNSDSIKIKSILDSMNNLEERIMKLADNSNLYFNKVDILTEELMKLRQERQRNIVDLTHDISEVVVKKEPGCEKENVKLIVNEKEDEEEKEEEEEEEEEDEEEEDEEEEEESITTEKAIGHEVVAVGSNKEEESDDEKSVETETKEEEEEEEELFEIEIDDVTYCTNDENNGFIYEFKNEEVGDKVGYFKDGEPIFYSDM